MVRAGYGQKGDEVKFEIKTYEQVEKNVGMKAKSNYEVSCSKFISVVSNMLLKLLLKRLKISNKI